MGVNLNIKEKRFGRKEVFANFHYSFQDRGLYVVRAKSGRGKTTLLRIIAGLDKDFSGTVDGVEKGRISMHLQEYRLFDTLTALENVYVLAYENASENEINSAAELLINLGFNKDELSLYPKELSGGMKMRVSLARAALKSADVLLLDEPTKELDNATRCSVLDLVNRISRDKLVIMVTHDNDIKFFENPTLIEL